MAQSPRHPDVQTISRGELQRKVEGPDGAFVLMETLEPEQFRFKHLPGAVNVPPDRLEALAPEFVPDRSTEIVTYCAGPDCHASLHAAHELGRLGYTHVRHFPGGKKEWAGANLPVERGA